MNMKTFLMAAVCAAIPSLVFAQVKETKLPQPRTAGGKPLMQCLKERNSQRAFSAKALSEQLLADLLWAADGVSRPDGHRTAPSAMNMQEIQIYVAKADGLFLYDAPAHCLTQVTGEDIREATGTQPFVKDAAVNLVYVADESRMGNNGARDIYAAADTGFISENVYLFCASEGLATVVRGSFDREKLSKAMKLRPEQKIVLCQTVGYPQ